jgi:hypothetical protein
MDFRSYGIMLALWAVMCFSTLYVHIYYHEMAHVQINSYLGIPSSRMTLTTTGGYVSMLTENPVLRSEAYRYHALNDIAGYNVLSVILAVFCVGLLTIHLKLMEDD